MSYKWYFRMMIYFLVFRQVISIVYIIFSFDNSYLTRLRHNQTTPWNRVLSENLLVVSQPQIILPEYHRIRKRSQELTIRPCIELRESSLQPCALIYLNPTLTLSSNITPGLQSSPLPLGISCKELRTFRQSDIRHTCDYNQRNKSIVL